MKKIVILSGPTATGKTQTAIQISKIFDLEIVNFDSLLFYKELNIGTAKPSLEERGEVPHHLIDVASINNPINASEYRKIGREVVEQTHNSSKIPLLVGGSGFYLNALLYGMFDSPTTPIEIVNEINQTYKEQGIAPFLKFLEESDPLVLKKLHPNDHYRILRAVEHVKAHKTSFAKTQEKFEEEKKPFISKDCILHCYLDIPKPDHAKVIIDRTEKMLESGLVSEVKNILSQGFDPNLRPLKSIGYKEIIEYLQNGEVNLNAYKDKIIVATRQLAKSQRTWFNRIKDKISFNSILEQKNLIKSIELFLKK